MENRDAEQFTVSHGFDGKETLGWYLEKKGAEAGEIDWIRGPGTISDVQSELRKELGAGNELDIYEVLETGLRTDVQQAARAFKEGGTPEQLAALQEARERATEARKDFPENDREQLALTLNADGAPVEIAPYGVGVEKSAHRLDITAERPLDIVVTANENKGKAVTVHFTSDYHGDVTVEGTGLAHAVREGEGPGDAIRTGRGRGDAAREGGGDGNAARHGDGYGCAFRSGAGDGDASRVGNGDGHAWREGSGKGSALVIGEGHGDAVVKDRAQGNALRDGHGNGTAYVEEHAVGHARRVGHGKGNAVVQNQARGNAKVDGDAVGEALNSSSEPGDAVNGSTVQGSAVRDGTGDGNAVRQGTGWGDATRIGKGDGHAWRAGEGRGHGVNGSTGTGAAIRTGDGEGLASRHGAGETIQGTISRYSPDAFQEEVRKLGAEHGIRDDSVQPRSADEGRTAPAGSPREDRITAAALAGEYTSADRLAIDELQETGAVAVLARNQELSPLPHIAARITTERGEDGCYRLWLAAGGGLPRANEPPVAWPKGGYLHAASAVNEARRILRTEAERDADKRESLEIVVNAEGRPTERPPEGVVIETSGTWLEISADRPLDVTVTAEKNIEPVGARYTSEHDGHLTVTGAGTAHAMRDGDGAGNANREGAGDGHATRTGSGDGTAAHRGRGSGYAFRMGSGRGDALCAAGGAGSAVVGNQAVGNAVRLGDGPGKATIENDAVGNAVRTGAGTGDADVKDDARGDAVVEALARGTARHSSTKRGDAVNQSINPGNAEHEGHGEGNAIRMGAGAGDAVRGGDGEGHAWRAGNGKGDAVNHARGSGAAIRTGDGEGRAQNIGSGKTIDRIVQADVPATLRAEIRKVSAQHGITDYRNEPPNPAQAPPKAANQPADNGRGQDRNEPPR